MASVSRDNNGRTRIQFATGDGRRRTIHLGKTPKKAAESFKLKVEAIIASQRMGTPVDAETASWLGSLPDDMHDKLARVGLVVARSKTVAVTLGELLDRFLKAQSTKEATRVRQAQAVRTLVIFFGAGSDPCKITLEQAEAWRSGLCDQY